MKIIRWFFSHILLILMVIVVIYSYMYWGNLLGSNTPAGKVLAYLSSEFEVVHDFVNKTRAKQAATPSDTAKTETKAEPAAPVDQQPSPEGETVVVEIEKSEQVTLPETEQQAAAEQQAATQPAETQPVTDETASHETVSEQPASVSYQYNQQLVTQDSSGHQSATSTPAPAQPVAAESPAPAQRAQPVASDQASPHYVSPEVEQQLNNVDDSGHVIDPSIPPGEAVRLSWIEARKAFYRRDYEKAEQNYRKVIENTEDNFDAYGELGNVYFNQGKHKEAADAYFEAASILIKRGQPRRAYSLMGLLRRLDTEKAKELQSLLQQSKP